MRYLLSTYVDSKNANKKEFKLRKNVIKHKLKIVSKSQAYFLTMTKTSVKFRKNRHKTRRSCAHKVLTTLVGYGMLNTMSLHFSSKRRKAGLQHTNL